MKLTRLSALSLTLFAVLPVTVHAGGKTCIPYVVSVPADYDAPAWASGMATSDKIDTSLDDPRWNGANANSFNYASATAPMHVRSAWKDGYLYLSFISNLRTSVGSGGDNKRDIFLGFRRKTSIGGENAYIFQVHLGPDSSTSPKAVPDCARWDGTTYECFGGGKPVYMRTFADQGDPETCGSVPDGRKFKQIASPTWLANNVHSWQEGDRWAVQMRLKLQPDDDTDPATPPKTIPTLEQGLEWNGSIWYEATQSENATSLLSLGKLPDETGVGTFTRCSQNLNDRIVHATLGDPNSWSAMSLLPKGAAPDGTCDGGLKIDRGALGTLVDTPQSGWDTLPLGIGLKARNATNTALRAVNSVVARVTNATSTAFTGQIRATFRIADWGATVAGKGDWITIPADAGTTNPVATPTTFSIPGGGQKALGFNWTMNEKDYCKYSLDVPGYACESCTPCADTGNGCTHLANTSDPCTPIKRKTHQCIQVELSAPNSKIKFSQASVFNNMDFGEMSTFQQDATIDVAGAPVVNGQREVILVVAARNLPAPTKTAVRTTGLEMLANNSLSLARKVSASHAKTIKRMGKVEANKRIGARIALTMTVANANNRLKDLGSADLVAFDKTRIALPEDDYRVTGALIDIAADAVQRAKTPTAGAKPAAELTRRLVDTLGPTAAARVVPTIEVYPFFRPAKGDIFQPMQPFSVFLSHEGTMLGFKVSDLTGDNLTKIDTNVYRLVIPAAKSKGTVTIKTEAVEPRAPLLTPTRTLTIPGPGRRPVPPSLPVVKPIKIKVKWRQP